MISHPVLDQLARSGVRLGLDRIKSFLTALGEPHRAVPVVHVAGTNGKGSVCAMVTAALVDAGYHVGTTYSPHVEQVNERVCFDGVPIDDAALSEAIDSVDRARWTWAETAGLKGQPLTYFELMAAVAFLLFAQRKVDVAVVEVGLGGRLDATNVVQPVVTAITHIGLDHVHELGTTIEEIAGEKAGILKRGTPVVLGPMPPEATRTIEARAVARACPLWRPGPQLRREHRQGAWSLASPGGTLRGVHIGMRGVHQGANALVAVGVLHQLRAQGFLIEDDAIASGIERAILPGRLEQPLPGLVLDGAHNRDGARVLAAWLEAQPRPATRILLLGMGADRNPIEVVTPLLRQVDEVVTTRCRHPKAWDPEELARALHDADTVLSAGASIEEMLPEVYAEADETVVTGSLFLAGAARSLVASGALDGIAPGQSPYVPEEE